jgi:hypothetical protein
MKRALLIVYLAVAMATPGLAQDTPDMVPIMQGESAPFTGMLVMESRFIDYIKLQMRVDELEQRLEIQKRLTVNIENLYASRLQETAQQEWYQTPEFNRWLGFGIGVLVTGLAVYGASRLK